MPDETGQSNVGKVPVDERLLLALLKALQEEVDSDRVLINSNTERTRQLTEQYRRFTETQRSILIQLKEMQDHRAAAIARTRRRLIYLFLGLQFVMMGGEVLQLLGFKLESIVLELASIVLIGIFALRSANAK